MCVVWCSAGMMWWEEEEETVAAAAAAAGLGMQEFQHRQF